MYALPLSTPPLSVALIVFQLDFSLFCPVQRMFYISPHVRRSSAYWTRRTGRSLIFLCFGKGEYLEGLTFPGYILFQSVSDTVVQLIIEEAVQLIWVEE